jgi:hypothetical protein
MGSAGFIAQRWGGLHRGLGGGAVQQAQSIQDGRVKLALQMWQAQGEGIKV